MRRVPRSRLLRGGLLGGSLLLAGAGVLWPAEDRDPGLGSLPSGAIAPDFRAPDPAPPMPFDPADEEKNE
jgi:hypothetical protein